MTRASLRQVRGDRKLDGQLSAVEARLVSLGHRGEPTLTIKATDRLTPMFRRLDRPKRAPQLASDRMTEGPLRRLEEMRTGARRKQPLITIRGVDELSAAFVAMAPLARDEIVRAFGIPASILMQPPGVKLTELCAFKGCANDAMKGRSMCKLHDVPSQFAQGGIVPHRSLAFAQESTHGAHDSMVPLARDRENFFKVDQPGQTLTIKYTTPDPGVTIDCRSVNAADVARMLEQSRVAWRHMIKADRPFPMSASVGFRGAPRNPCTLDYRGAACTYDGPMKSCNKSEDDCRAHDNFVHFGGGPGWEMPRG